ncbi:MAG: bifunctional folylpolyglutamate synthase/dihydrofolate synthase [Culicoidibacterales bacterium]
MKFQTSKEVLAFFDQFRVTTIDLTLSRMEQALALLGNPHQQYPTIHIGGTNGKGSTTSFLRNILQAHGCRVATFTSPHIETFHERMQVNGEMISDAALLTTTNFVFSKLGTKLEQLQLTQFELMALVMFVYFADQQPDFAIIEVGMGGRFDATNVITPLVSVLTNVSLDHQNFLGDTLSVIANEKAGIIKPKTPIVTTTNDSEVLAIIAQAAQQQGSELAVIGRAFHVREVKLLAKASTFTYQFGQETPVQATIHLKGRYQVENASAALTVIHLLAQQGKLQLEMTAIQQGLEATTWLGRMEELVRQPLTYVDGAHNEAGITQLCELMTTYFVNQRCHVIFCAMADKDVATMIPQLEAVATTLTLTSFTFPRAAKAADLAAFAHGPVTVNEDFAQAYAYVCEQAKFDDVILITGSLYFVSYVRNILKKS